MRRPAYAERAPDPRLAPTVQCVWTGWLAGDGTPFVDSVLPDGCIDLIWDGRRLFVAGPDTGPVPIARVPGALFAGIRFRPGAAPGFLGVPASDLRDARVEAPEVLGDRAHPMVDRLAAASGPRAAACVLERAALGWLRQPPGPPPGLDPLVAAAVAWLADPLEAHPVGGLADRLGVGERQLHRRCLAAIGYGPKTLHRVLRFRRWLALAERWPEAGLAHLAAQAGYSDQAHLAREVHRLAGVTPVALLATWRPAA